MTSKSCLARLQELYHVCSSNSSWFRSVFCGLTLGLLRAGFVTGFASGVKMEKWCKDGEVACVLRGVAIGRGGAMYSLSFPFACCLLLVYL